MMSPLRRAGASMAGSFRSGAAWAERTSAGASSPAGPSTDGATGGNDGEAGPQASATKGPDSPRDGGGGAAASAGSADMPGWAKRMRRTQQMSQSVQSAAHAVKSGDSHGGGSSVNLSESD